MFIDQPSYHGGQGYMAFETHDIASADWKSVPDADLPSSPRHGTVLPVTQEELDRMRLDLQPDLLVESVEPLTATTKAGTAPVLPEKATVHYADGSTQQKTVDWDDIDPAKYADLGTFEVEGDVAPGSTVRAKATVTVTRRARPERHAVDQPGQPRRRGRLVEVRPGQRHGSPASTTARSPSVETSIDEGPWTPVDAAAGHGAGHRRGCALGTCEGNRRERQRLAGADARPQDRHRGADQQGLGRHRRAYRQPHRRRRDVGRRPRRVEDRVQGSGPPVLSVSVGSGETVVQFRAVDKAGNAEEPNTVTVPAVGQGLRDSVTAATLSASKVRYGTNVTVTARVNGSGATPTGAVRVLSGDTLVGTGTLGQRPDDDDRQDRRPRQGRDASRSRSATTATRTIARPTTSVTLTVTKASSKVSVSTVPSTDQVEARTPRSA